MGIASVFFMENDTSLSVYARKGRQRQRFFLCFWVRHSVFKAALYRLLGETTETATLSRLLNGFPKHITTAWTATFSDCFGLFSPFFYNMLPKDSHEHIEEHLNHKLNCFECCSCTLLILKIVRTNCSICSTYFYELHKEHV